MLKRPFIHVRPLHFRERRVDAVRLMHERYRGFFAEPHAHAEQQLTMPLSGRMHLSVDGGSHLIGPESAILLPAEVPHEVTFLDGEVEYLVVSAPAGWVEEAGRRLGGDLAPIRQPRVFSDPLLWPLARHLSMELEGGSEGLLRAGVEQVGLLSARSLLAPVRERGAGGDPRILRALDQMLRRYGEDLTVTELAREATMTARHFERRFKEELGVSPKRYLIDVRHAVAADLLVSTDWAVMRVAHAVGFAQPSHFIESFRRAKGQTPMAYRKAHGGASGGG